MNIARLPVATAVATLLAAGSSFAANPTAVVETTMGTIEVELFADKAPVSTKNFIEYAESGAYNGTVFHRVISSFMIQGGGFDSKYQKRPSRAPIQNEATNGLSNTRGTLAMARTSVVNSATQQFFINVVDNKRLDHSGTDPRGFGYAVFGRVTKGLDVVDRMRGVPTGACGAQLRRDCPQTAIIITKVTVNKAPAAKPAAPAKGQ